jgi:putative acetyltransferase
MNRAPEIRQPFIRKGQPSDRDGIWNVFLTSVLEHFRTHYENAEALSFANSIEPESFDDSINTRPTLVAEEDGKIVAFGQFNIEQSEFVSLYVAPGFTRRGLGQTLLRKFEDLAQKAGSGWMQAGSTLNAVGFFEKEGYKQTRMEQLQLPDGSSLPRIRMSKSFPE